ncbi:MAG: response regulator [bacterium]|nr:response regulator [bacterium]
MAGETILVVDDEKNILNLSDRILENEGFRVITAGSGEEALKLLDKESVDLLLTDIRMPGMDGMELLTRFKRQRPDNAAVIFTGHGTIDMTIEALGVGADGFVLKPFTKTDLTGTVNNALEKVRLMRENIRLKALLPLFEVSSRMVETLDVKELLSYAADVAGKETGADSVSIMLKDGDGAFKTELQKGLKKKSDKEVVVRLSEKMAEKAAATGQPVILGRDDGEGDFSADMQNSDILTSIVLPMKMRGEILGAMNLTSLKGNDSLLVKGVADFLGILASQAASALKNTMLIEDLQALFMSLIRSLSKAIDTKSPWTAGHSERVTIYALHIGESLGLNEEEMKALELAGILHDIGKIGVYEAVLDKPGTLTDDEFEMVKKHPAAGAEIISKVGQLKDIILPVRHHHERYDGCGYPDGLVGEAIPRLSRILSVADTYDAMKTNRPYRTGMTKEVIINELATNAGTQFDPEPVSALLKLIKNGSV